MTIPLPDVIERLWLQIEPVVYITKRQFLAILAEWKIEPVVIDEELAFVWLTKGPEFHLVSFETGHALSRKMIRSQMDVIMEQNGFALTKTPRDGYDRQHRFNLAFGYKVVGNCEFYVHYKLEPKCHS